jgi:hypothetical protein
MITPNDNEPKTDSENTDIAAASLWIPVTEQMPKVGCKVLVCGHYSNGNRWRALAKWQPAGTMGAELWDEAPDDWWDEDGNVYTNPTDLWVEYPLVIEQCGFLDNVTHWMPLPDMPNKQLSN